jgi:hypothetical protein
LHLHQQLLAHLGYLPACGGGDGGNLYFLFRENVDCVLYYPLSGGRNQESPQKHRNRTVNHRGGFVRMPRQI